MSFQKIIRKVNDTTGTNEQKIFFLYLRSTVNTANSQAMTTVGFSRTTEQWVSDTCELLRTDSWDQNRPLCLDMSSGWLPEFRESGFVSILEALSCNTSVRTLQLKNMALEATLSLRAALRTMLAENQSLRSLIIENVRECTKSTPTSLPATVPACLFQDSSHLKELAVERCTLDSKATMALARMIRHNHSLKSLKLSNIVFQGDSLVKEIACAISEHSGTGLESLEISNTHLSKEARAELLTSIATNTSLTSVNLDDMNLGLAEAPRLATILQSNRHLTTLSLRANNLNGKAAEILVQEGFSKHATLEHLSLAFNPVGDDGVVHLSTWLTEQTQSQPKHNLQSLDLEFSEIWHGGCLILAKSLSRTACPLHRLDLDGNDMEHCADELLEAVRQNMTISHISGTAFLAFSDRDDDNSIRVKQWKEIDCLLRLHRANRMMTTPPALPLWPRVLERWNKDVDVLYHLLSQNPGVAQKPGKSPRD